MKIFFQVVLKLLLNVLEMLLELLDDLEMLLELLEIHLPEEEEEELLLKDVQGFTYWRWTTIGAPKGALKEL